MADQLRKIKPALKRQLVQGAGDKCANPGCANSRTHIHHIKHWAVYKAHDSEDMIAVCPACHDEIHYGRLKISDDTLYRWKGIQRVASPHRGHLYVEPSNTLKLLAGSICFSTNGDQATVFELSNSNDLRLRVLDREILQVNCRLRDLDGSEVLQVVENYVRVCRDDTIECVIRSGRARIVVHDVERYVPDWMIAQMRIMDPAFAADGEVMALDLEVLEPGLVRVRGCWPDKNTGVVISDELIAFCGLEHKSLGFKGAHEDTVIIVDGHVTRAVFGFEGQNESATVSIPRLGGDRPQ